MTKRTSKARCNTRRCFHKAAVRGLCWTCYNRIRRAADPVARSFYDLQQNVRKRNRKRKGPPIAFTITLEYFRTWCRKTRYIQGAGRSKDAYTIDRIENDKGYEPGNIQKMKRWRNSQKGAKILHYDWQNKTATVTTCTPDSRTSDGADNPF